MTKPILSIGLIFRNDIRCIERCLKALQPLREAVPSELVMADTGSTDGSREVAEKYADLVFDFPWIDDFAAARNAVIDRCSGEWYLSVDTDEYLNKGAWQIAQFLSQSGREEKGATVIIRNFYNYELTGNYTDFMGVRLAHISMGFRYEGIIHEGWNLGGSDIKVCPLNEVVFDHDGYVATGGNEEAARAKKRRNVNLLRKKLKEEPDSLLSWMQLLESGDQELDYVELLRHAVELVREKKPDWEMVGPVILEHAVSAADSKNLPEFDEWLQMAQQWFPESMYIRLDVEWTLFARSWNKKDYADCISRGERFLTAMDDFRAGADPTARVVSILQMATPLAEQRLKIYLAGAYCNSGVGFERALELLGGLDYELSDAQQVVDILKSLQEICFRSNLDTTPFIRMVWDSCRSPKPSQEQAKQRRMVFFKLGGTTFTKDNRSAEERHKDFCRHAYMLYLPLDGECELGTAAAIMETKEALLLEKRLAGVKDWGAFPIQALAHALEMGARFPLPGKCTNVELLDSLSGRLSEDKDQFFPLALRLLDHVDSEDWQGLVWANSVAAAAVRTYPWRKDEPNVEQGMALARAFAKVEGEILPLSYSPEILKAERMFALPPLHRFGWYCAQAFEALGAGSAASYVRLLREGLTACEGIKDMVEFLLGNTPELKDPSNELKAMAEQIRAVLAKFSPDNPAVSALKQSEAYQKVAYLIEGTAPPVTGGLLQ